MDNFTLLAVDGLNLVRRVYEANPSPDSDDKANGRRTERPSSSLKRAVREHQPTHALLAFVRRRPTPGATTSTRRTAKAASPCPNHSSRPCQDC